MTTGAVDWEKIRLVVFDVDGTLYDQRAMRLRMLRDLASDAVRTRSLATLRALRTYRQLRESLGRREVEGFEEALISQTATKHRMSDRDIRRLAAEWIEQHPLAYIRRCRYPGIDDLFVALRRRKKTIGILSDYPAAEKLRAMGLEADLVVSATDGRVGIQKPNPRGLLLLMSEAGASPESTVLIGDRPETDGEAARRAGALALIRSDRPRGDWPTFSGFSDPIFDPLLKRPAC